MGATNVGATPAGRVVSPRAAGAGAKPTRRSINPEVYRRRQAAQHAANVADTCGRLGLSQPVHTDLLGIARRTLENWEPGRRAPTGAATVLLMVAGRHPEVALEAVAKQAVGLMNRVFRTHHALAASSVAVESHPKSHS